MLILICFITNLQFYDPSSMQYIHIDIYAFERSHTYS